MIPLGDHLQDHVPRVGHGHELIQCQLIEYGIERVVDLRDVKDDALCAVVLRHPETDRDGDATMREEEPRPTLENGCEGTSLDVGICSFLKTNRLMRLRATVRGSPDPLWRICSQRHQS
jgi:hypothetical protein